MRQLRHAILCGLLLASAGCMQYLVSAPAPEIAGSPHEVPAQAYLGSELQKGGYILARECQGREQLARVLVRRDFWQGFVSWISLGLITPATVVYECANAAGQGELGNSSDGGGGR
jgi:hypothetical protein